MNKTLVVFIRNYLYLYKKKNKKHLLVRYNKTNLLVSDFLIKHGFCYSRFFVKILYKKKAQKHIKLIFNNSTRYSLNYYGSQSFKYVQTFNRFVFVSSINKRVHFPYSEINKRIIFNKIMLISSDIGLITCADAVKKKKGGILIGYFIL